MKVLVTDIAWPAPTVERAVFDAAGHELVLAESGDEATLRALASGCGAIATCWAQVPASVIEAAGPGLKHIARYGVGLDNIDVAFATAHGILVTNVPDYCVEEVADQTLALLLALARRTLQLDRALRTGTFSPQAAGQLHRLRGQTCGVVGLGKVGAAVARRAAAFGMRVITSHPRLTSAEAAARGAELTAFDTVLAESDFLSLHCPLTPDTHHLINRETLARMKPSAYVINTSRGPLIDTDALVEALREGRLAGAGLDVLEGEPLPPSHPLYALESVVVAPHAAFYSEESVEELQRRTAEEVVRVAAGEDPRNPVNLQAIAANRR